jgi:hypothetical protein
MRAPKTVWEALFWLAVIIVALIVFFKLLDVLLAA